MRDDIDELFSLLEQIRTKVIKKNLFQDTKGLTILQIAALMYLSFKEKVTVTDLSSHLGISPSSTTQLIDRLVQTKIVSRLADESDRRISWILLTDHGKENIEMHKKKMTQKMREVFSKIPLKDIKEMVRIQKNILSVIEKENK